MNCRVLNSRVALNAAEGLIEMDSRGARGKATASWLHRRAAVFFATHCRVSPSVKLRSSRFGYRSSRALYGGLRFVAACQTLARCACRPTHPRDSISVNGQTAMKKGGFKPLAIE